MRGVCLTCLQTAVWPRLQYCKREEFVCDAQKIVDSNADLAVKKSEAAQRQQNAAIATDVAVRQQQVRELSHFH